MTLGRVVGVVALVLGLVAGYEARQPVTTWLQPARFSLELRPPIGSAPQVFEAQLEVLRFYRRPGWLLTRMAPLPLRPHTEVVELDSETLQILSTRHAPDTEAGAATDPARNRTSTTAGSRPGLRFADGVGDTPLGKYHGVRSVREGDTFRLVAWNSNANLTQVIYEVDARPTTISPEQLREQLARPVRRVWGGMANWMR